MSAAEEMELVLGPGQSEVGQTKRQCSVWRELAYRTSGQSEEAITVVLEILGPWRLLWVGWEEQSSWVHPLIVCLQARWWLSLRWWGNGETGIEGRLLQDGGDRAVGKWAREEDEERVKLRL